MCSDLQLHPPSLSFLLDQAGAEVGGGRFTRELCKELIAHVGRADGIGRLLFVATQNELLDFLGPLPSGVQIMHRRFPSRLRNTVAARLFGRMLPTVDVAFGPFYYAFPNHGAARIITIHDVSPLYAQYHPLDNIRRFRRQMDAMVRNCARLVCDSDATRDELIKIWPAVEAKCERIYLGVTRPDAQLESNSVRENLILTVGTIEPRKNHAGILDAFEILLQTMGANAPRLLVIGRYGWMCESVARRLRVMQRGGMVEWMDNASDADIARAYARAKAFTYPSFYEGFGYPPFEAAFAGVPMVLSNCSSVGEIWSKSARCVNPKNPADIAAALQWALTLAQPDRQRVVLAQIENAKRFGWKACAQQYTNLFVRHANEVTWCVLPRKNEHG